MKAFFFDADQFAQLLHNVRPDDWRQYHEVGQIEAKPMPVEALDHGFWHVDEVSQSLWWRFNGRSWFFCRFHLEKERGVTLGLTPAQNTRHEARESAASGEHTGAEKGTDKGDTTKRASDAKGSRDL